MGFAIVGYFDEEADVIIKDLWQKMADSGTCNYLINSETIHTLNLQCLMTF